MIKGKTAVTFLLSAIAVVVAIGFTKKNFHAKFHNQAGSDIDSLFIGTTHIGRLRDGDSTENISFRKFNLIAVSPMKK